MSSQLCRYYPNCTNKFCTFSHPKTTATSKVPCSFHQRGICKKGDNCPYMHANAKESTNASAKATASAAAEAPLKSEATETGASVAGQQESQHIAAQGGSHKMQ